MSLPVEKTLDSLRIDVVKEDGDERWALCPQHEKRTGKADHNPSWSINVDTGAHFCFSCGYKGNLFTLVRDIRGKKAADALVAETEQFGRPVSVSDNVRRPGNIQRPDDDSGGLNLLPESWLSIFSASPPEWALTKRRVNMHAVETYGVRWDTDKSAWVLPMRHPDDYHRLVGYQAKGEKSRYFRNRPRNMAKANTLFGIDVVEPDACDVVVVESPLDAVLLYRLGYNAVAICGARVSDAQLRLLRRYDSLIFALDNDAAGFREHKRLKEIVRAKFLRYDWAWKDVGDMPDDEIVAAVER